MILKKTTSKSLINGMVCTCVNIFTVKNTLQIKGNNSYMCVYTDIHICIHVYDCLGKLRACHVGLVVSLSHGRSWVCAPARSYTCDDIYMYGLICFTSFAILVLIMLILIILFWLPTSPSPVIFLIQCLIRQHALNMKINKTF